MQDDTSPPLRRIELTVEISRRALALLTFVIFLVIDVVARPIVVGYRLPQVAQVVLGLLWAAFFFAHVYALWHVEDDGRWRP